MRKQINLLKLPALAILGLSAVLISCSNQEQDLLANDLSTTQDQELALKVDDLTKECVTRATEFGDGDVNIGVNKKVDDRSCVYDYKQRKVGNKTFGVYRLRANTSSDSHQTRMERATKRVNKKHGNRVQVKGTCIINRVGTGDPRANTDIKDRDGTYFIQAKGGDNLEATGDPVVALFLAKKLKIGNDIYFEIFREEIIFRRGNVPDGRKLVYITRVKSGKEFKVVLTTGFHKPAGKPLSHYVNAKINGVVANWKVPTPEEGTNAYIRMGTYRCKGGEAEVLWGSDLTTTRVNL